METDLNQRKPDGSVFGGLEVDHNVQGHLLEAAKWGRILAIIGFIMLGLVLIVGIFAGSSIDYLPGVPSGGGAIIIVIILLIIALYFYPIYALFKFSSLTSTGLQTRNQLLFTEGMAWLKRMLRYMAILLIIGIALNILSAIFNR